METNLRFVLHIAAIATQAAWSDMGTSGLGWALLFLIPIGVAFMRAYRAPEHQRWAAVVSHWKSELRDVFIVTFFVGIAIFAYEALWNQPHKIWTQAALVTPPQPHIPSSVDPCLIEPQSCIVQVPPPPKLPLAPPKTPKIPSIQVKRESAILPITVLPNHEALIMVAHENKTVDFERFTNSGDKPAHWGEEEVDAPNPHNFVILRYGLVNRSSKIVYNIQADIWVNFGNHKEGPDAVARATWNQLLMVPGTVYEFYAVNQSSEFISVQMPQTISLQIENESERRNVPLETMITNPVDALPGFLFPYVKH